MPEISLLLLGAPEVRVGETLVSIHRRIPRVVLFYLASHGGMLGRGTLLSLFWEDSPEQTARQRLREVLSRLRAALPRPDLILAKNDLVGLDQDQAYVDQLKFESLLEQVGRLPWQIPAHEPLPEEVNQCLMKAANLWRGPNFLDGADIPSTTGLDDWWTRTNQRLIHSRSRVLERLAAHAEVTGDLDLALSLTRSALQSENFNEDLHYRVLHLLLALDRRHEAREYFTYVQKLIRAEFNSPPGPKIMALFHEMGASLQPSPGSTQPEWRVWPGMHTPFVGRYQPIARLRRAIHKGGGIFIFGESGQGKTRLVQEFYNQQSSQWRVLLAHCRPAETNLPFQPIIELLRNNLSREEWSRLGPVWKERLALLLPELVTLHPGLRSPDFDDPGRARSLVLEAIRQIFITLAQESNLILFLDDAQWADEATLSTVAYLIERQPFRQQSLLVVAARREEPNAHLVKLLASLRASQAIEQIQLTQLNPEEIAGLTRHVLGFEPSRAVTERLARDTGGNPLFILETLHALLDRNIPLAESDVLHFPLAESLSTLIRSRLRRLTPLAREAIELAAMLGTEFDPEAVSMASHKDLFDIVRALEELEALSLVEPVMRNPEEARYRFIHDKFREAILQDLSLLRSQVLHLHVAKTLESMLGPEVKQQAATLAQHYEVAGEFRQALQYWVQAAQYARQLLSIQDASRIFSHAEKLIDRAGSRIPDELLHNLYASWTEMAFELNDTHTIIAQNTNLLRLGKERHSPLLIGTALDGLGDACMTANDFEAGLEYENQAIHYLQESGNLFELIDAYNHRGLFLYMLNRLNESVEAFQDVLALSIASNDAQVMRARATAHYHLSLLRILSGWPESGQKHAIRALEDSSRIGHYHGQITAYNNLALSKYFLGENLQARHVAQQGLDLAERSEARRMLGYLHTILAMIELSLGRLGAAIDHASQAITLGEQNNHSDIIAFGNRAMGDVFIWLRAPRVALQYYQRGETGNAVSFWTIDSRFRAGYALVSLGQIEAGLKQINHTLEISDEIGLDIVSLLASIALGFAHVNLQKWEKVEQIATNLQKEAIERSIPLIYILSTVQLGEVALRRGDIPTGLQLLRLAALKAKEQSHPLLELRVLESLSAALQKAGQPEGATQQRVQHLLAQLEKTLTAEPSQQAFEAFRHKLSARIMAHSHG